jgi:hypothetical protein
VEKCGGAGQAADYKACWIAKATHTHTLNVLYLLLFHGNSGYANAHRCYVYTYIARLVYGYMQTQRDRRIYFESESLSSDHAM